MTYPERIYLLIDKYASGSATPAEKEELAALLEQPSGDEAAKDYLLQLLQHTPQLPEHSEARWLAIHDDIRGMSAKRRSGIGRKFLPWAAAAVLIGIVTFSYLMMPKRTAHDQPVIAIKHDRPPGGSVATLTLADGSTIVLDSVHNGLVAQQGSTHIAKQGNGQLVYKATAGNAVPVLNILSTPKGGQYRLVLPDGTAVWLNAASSITYPTVFNGPERIVRITGEAYFEVKKDAAKPFTVFFHKGVDSGKVEVLGTNFNINAYTDEVAIRTTLLEGSVRVVGKGKESTTLKPGQQAAVNMGDNGRTSLIPDADMDDVMAWKNGRFHFENADIQTVMRQIARWYNVEVVYEGRITTEKFEGDISRNSRLTEVFKILELSKVHFKIEDKTVTVMP